MMRKKAYLVFLAALGMLLAAGCQKEEENPIGEGVNPPVETVTDAPSEKEEGTPTGEVQGDYWTYTFREETTEEKEGDYVYFKSRLYYPVFEGENAEVLNGVVTSLSGEFREFLPEAREDAENNYESALLTEFEVLMFPEEQQFIVKCFWETEKYVTLFTQNISYTGGAHSNVLCQAYVVDVTDGHQMSLEQMLKPYGLTTENIIEYATENIMEEYGEVLFEYDDAVALEENVIRFIRENQWYFTENGLVLFANPYEIAAYAFGLIECEISYEELEQGLKK